MKEQGKNLICDIAGGLAAGSGMWCFTIPAELLREECPELR